MSPAKIPSSLIDEIKSKLNIVDIVGEHVVLKKSGSNHVGLCPFHSERTPSFGVSETKQLYHCYGCKAGGDLLSFFQDLHGLNFGETIEELASRASVKLPKDLGNLNSKSNAENQLAFKLNRFAAALFRKNLSQENAATAYLKDRHVTEEMSKYFYLGSAPRSWDQLAKQLKEAQAPLDVGVKVGLIRPSTKPGEFPYFDLFRERLIFPISDLRGRVCGFGGRLLPQQSEGPKYLNSPESKVFQKSRILFGLYQAKKYIREEDAVILVEGYFDVMALVHAGVRNVVATCGTALTPEHLDLMTRFTKNIIVFFDSDSAGEQATEKAMLLGLQKGLVLRGAAIPSGKDPDEFLFGSDLGGGSPKPGATEKLAELVKNGGPLLDARIEAEITDSSKGPEEKTASLKKIGGWLQVYKDPIGREVRIQKVEKDLGISRAVFMSSSKKNQPSRHQSRSQPARPQAPAPRQEMRKGAPVLEKVEKVLLKGWVLAEEFEEFWKNAGRSLPPKMTISDLFRHPGAHQYVVNTGGSWDPEQEEINKTKGGGESFLNELDPQTRSTITEAAMQASGSLNNLKVEDLSAAFFQVVSHIWARFSQSLKVAIADAEAKDDRQLHASLMKDYLDVQRKMKELKRFL